MAEKDDTEENRRNPALEAGLDFGAFLIAFVFVWIVFDNLALGLLAGLIFGGGSRATRKRQKSD